MGERASTSGSSYLLALVALILLFLIIPAAAAAARRLKPAWRAWVWPLIFASFTGTSLCAGLAATLNVVEPNQPIWKAVNLLAGLAFHFLALSTLYRAVPERLGARLAPLLWAVYLVFAIGVVYFNSFVPVLLYDAACSVLVFLVYSTLYARDRDRAADALSIMIGTGLVLLADLIASFIFTLELGPLKFGQLVPYNFLQVLALIYFFKGASASYSVKYDMERSRERTLSGR